jgi:DNA-binding NarL/FixJ family response regulator
MVVRVVAIPPSALSVPTDLEYDASLMKIITTADASANATMSTWLRMTVAMRKSNPKQIYGIMCHADPDPGRHMIRIAIVDDHAMVRAGLRQFFSDQIDFQVVAEAANGREALDIVRKGEVDVILLDISMPGQGGVDTLAAIRARAPDLPVLILSGFPEEHYATTLLRQGASGYLNKDCDPEEIVRAIRTVFRGRKYITAGVAERLADSLTGGGDKAPHETLSERELQVFLRLAKGETIGHMAESMSLSVKTVSTYRTRVMEKMQLESNSDLTYYALKNGLIQ